MVIPYRWKKYIKPLVVVLIVTIVSLGAVVGIKAYMDWRSGASPTVKPKDLYVTDTTDKSVTISWVTDTPVEGYVVYGTDSNNLDQYTRDLRDLQDGSLRKDTIHYVVMSGLQPGTKYYYKIVSGSKKFGDENSNAFSFNTYTVDQIQLKAPKVVYGVVTNGENSSAIVYITLEKDGQKSLPLATLTNDEGGWQVDLSRARKENGSYFTVGNSDKMQVVAVGGAKGGGTIIAQVDASPEQLDVTMSSDFTTRDLLAEVARTETEEEGQEIAEAGGTEEATSDQTNDSGEVTGNTTYNTGTTSGSSTYGTNTSANTGTPESNEIDRSNVSWTSMDQNINMGHLVEESSQSSTFVEVATGEDSIKIVNIMETKFGVMWITDTKCIGCVKYGDTMDSMDNTAYDVRDTVASQNEFYTHLVNVTDLTPGAVYYFLVESCGEEYNNDGNYHTVELPEALDSPPPLKTVSGKVTSSNPQDSIVTVVISDEDGSGSSGSSSDIAVVPDSNGNFSVSIGDIRTVDLGDYFNSTDGDTVNFTAITYSDQDTDEITVGNIDTTTASLTLDSYGADESTTASFDYGLVGLGDAGGNSPKTAYVTNSVRNIVASVVLLTLGVTVKTKNAGREWENNLLQKVSAQDEE